MGEYDRNPGFISGATLYLLSPSFYCRKFSYQEDCEVSGVGDRRTALLRDGGRVVRKRARS